MVQDLVFLRLLYPRLVVWFDWFNTSQVSGGLGPGKGMLWRGIPGLGPLGRVCKTRSPGKGLQD